MQQFLNKFFFNQIIRKIEMLKNKKNKPYVNKRS